VTINRTIRPDGRVRVEIVSERARVVWDELSASEADALIGELQRLIEVKS